MSDDPFVARMVEALSRLGVGAGAVIMVHSSLKAFGVADLTPETVICALHRAVGESGTVLMPALSYEQEPPDIHETLRTRSNVGVIPETFRLQAGTIRSVHPTHSVCGAGPLAEALLSEHQRDSTPCGPHSPFRRILDLDAKIVMLGCGLRPNTTMHAVEELAPPPYLFGDERTYTITPPDTPPYEKTYRTHGFDGWIQRYDRIAELDDGSLLVSGRVLDAPVQVIDARALKRLALPVLQLRPLHFVDRSDGGSG